jgi:putative ABC transport system substrate-binding protein
VRAFVHRLAELGWIEGRTVAIEYRWAAGSLERATESFAKSLARPGGNLTGLSLQTTDHASKRVELLHTLVPAAGRLAMLFNGANPGVVLELREAEMAARALGLQSSTFEIRRAEDIAPAFEAMKESTDALYVCNDVLVNVNRVRINTHGAGR